MQQVVRFGIAYRPFSVAALLCLLLALAACGKGSGAVLPRTGSGGFALRLDPAALDSTGGAGRFELSVSTAGPDSTVVSVLARDAREVNALSLAVDYDSARFTPQAATAADPLRAAWAGGELLELAVLDIPGTAYYGCALAGAAPSTGFSGNAVVAELRFTAAPFAADRARTASTLPATPGTRAVLRLAAQDVLAWPLANPGDYDQNGEVNPSDLTALAQHFHAQAPPGGFAPDSALAVIDGDGNGEVNLADIQTIGTNFHHSILGYRVFGSADLADYPAGDSAANGTGAVQLGEVPFSAALGSADERKHFSFTLPASGQKYWVRPFAAEGLGSPSNLLDTELRLKPNAKVVSSTSLALLSSFAPNGDMTFSAGNAELATLAPGDIIAGAPTAAAPNGLLRRVLTVGGGGTVLTTEPADLTDALSNGLCAFNLQLTQGDVKSASAARPGVTWVRGKGASTASGSEFFLGLDGVVIADEDGDPSTKNDQIKLDGSLGFDPSLLFDLDIDLSGVHEFTFGAEVNVHSSLTLTGAYAKTWDKEVTLYSWTFTPITFFIGPFPVVLVPSIDLVLGTHGTITANLVLSVSDDAHAAARIGYKDGSWGVFPDAANHFNFADPLITGTASAKAYAGIKPQLLLYGVAGATGLVDAYLQADADIAANPWYNLKGGIEATLGVSALGLSYSEQVFDYSSTLVQAPGGFTPSTGPPSYAASFDHAHGTDLDKLHCILPLPDGGYLAGGETFLDQLLLRVGPDGQLAWSHELGAGAINSLCPASDGNYIAVGDEIGDAALLMFSPDGDLLWIEKAGGNAGTADRLYAVQPLKFGGYLACGSFGNDTTFDDPWVLAFDEQGSLLASTTWPDASDSFLQGLARLPDGSLFAAGQSGSGPGGGDALVMRFDPAGALLWAREQRLYPDGLPLDDYWEWATAVSALPGGCYLAGQTNRGGLTQWTARLDADGNAVWAKLCTSGDFALTWDVFATAVSPDGGLLVAGTTGSGVGAGAFDGFVMKYTGAGDPSWATAFGGVHDDSLRCLAVPLDGKGILAGGGSLSFRTDGEEDAWALRLTDTGTVFFNTPGGGEATSLSGTVGSATLGSAPYSPAPETPLVDVESLNPEVLDWPAVVRVLSNP